jgi:hypothetical protein
MPCACVPSPPCLSRALDFEHGGLLPWPRGMDRLVLDLPRARALAGSVFVSTIFSRSDEK